MSPKDADGMASSVDPDQTAPSGLHCLPRQVYPKTWDHSSIYRKYPIIYIAEISIQLLHKVFNFSFSTKNSYLLFWLQQHQGY